MRSWAIGYITRTGKNRIHHENGEKMSQDPGVLIVFDRYIIRRLQGIAR